MHTKVAYEISEKYINIKFYLKNVNSPIIYFTKSHILNDFI